MSASGWGRCIALTALGSILGTPPAAALPDSISVHVTVFLDENADGVRQITEGPLPGIRVTNGLDVFATDPQGQADVTVDREIYRFATLTIPAGFWPSAAFYHFVPIGSAGPDTVEFGLKPYPATANDPARFVHISDTHVNTNGVPPPIDDELLEIAELPAPPPCIFNTGDLVGNGSHIAWWDKYVVDIGQSALRVFNVVGNHDTVSADPLQNYEPYVGPPYYSMEMGSWHFIVWNSEQGSPRQGEWLLNDLAAAPVGSHHALMQHRLSAESPPSSVALWISQGVRHVFSGHWHCNQIGRHSNGIRDFNVGWTPFGPIDRTPRGFSVVTCAADGSVSYDLRRFGVDHRALVVSPAEADTVVDSSVPVLVQAYDTTARVSSMTVTVTGPGAVVIPVPVVAEGISLWRGQLSLVGRPGGSYLTSVSGTFEDGAPFSATAPFEVAFASHGLPQLGDDWPMFRKSAAGSSFTAQPLVPPLRFQWVAATDGMTALGSPVVADGRVVFGVRAETRAEDAAVAAFDALTGAQLWRTEVPSGVGLAPAVAGGVVIVNALADSVYGLDLATGQRLWADSKWAHRYDFTAPIVDGPAVWVSSRPTTMEIQWANGAVNWTTQSLGSPFYPYIYGAPAVDPTSLYQGSVGLNVWGPGTRALLKISRLDGSFQVWDSLGVWRSPIAAGDTLYLVGGSAGDTFDPAQRLATRNLDGSIHWTAAENLERDTASPALGHGILVASGQPPQQPARIHGFRASDGATLWTHTFGTGLFQMAVGYVNDACTSSSPAIADSVVYVGSLDGHLYALDLFTGAELWKHFLGTPIASSPAISGDFLYVGASDGHLYAFARVEPGAAVTVPIGAQAPRESLTFTSAPNPGRGEMEFLLVLPRTAHAALKVFDVQGRLVHSSPIRSLDAGSHRVVWDGRDRSGKNVPAGVYFARLEAEDRTVVRKVVLLRQ